MKVTEAPPDTAVPPGPSGDRGRRRLLLAVVTVAVLMLAAVALPVALRHPAGPRAVIAAARARQRRRRQRIALGAAPVVGAGAGWAAAGGPGSRWWIRPAPPSPAAWAVRVLGNQAGWIFRNPAGLGVAAGVLWVFNSGTGLPSVSELSAATGRWLHLRRPGLQFAAQNAFLDRGHLWYLAYGSPGLTEVSPWRVTGLVSSCPSCAVPAGGRLWVVARGGSGSRLVELSAGHGALLRVMPWPRGFSFEPQGMVKQGNLLWLVGYRPQARYPRFLAVELDLATGRVRWFPLPGYPGGASPAGDLYLGRQLVLAGGHVFILGEYVDELAGHGAISRWLTAADPTGVAGSGPDLWVSYRYGGYRDRGWVAEYNVRTGRVTGFTGRRYHFDRPQAVTAGDGSIWVLNRDSVTRLTPRRP
jgi:hypothetical protein